MKSKNDIFNEKMPSSLHSKILSQSDSLLAENKNLHRKSIFTWIIGLGVATAIASFSLILFRQKDLNTSRKQLEVAQSMDLFEEIQSEEDLDLLADFDLIENLDLINEIDIDKS